MCRGAVAREAVERRGHGLERGGVTEGSGSHVALFQRGEEQGAIVE